MRKYFVDYGNVEYMTISLDNARKIANSKGKPLEIYSMVECSKDCFMASSKQIELLEASEQSEQIEQAETNEQFEQPKEPKEQIEQMFLF